MVKIKVGFKIRIKIRIKIIEDGVIGGFFLASLRKASVFPPYFAFLSFDWLHENGLFFDC